MIGTTVETRYSLREQTYESRERNVRQIIERQLGMQFDIQSADGCLWEAGFTTADGDITTRGKYFAQILGKVFPFLNAAETLVVRATTFDDLTRLIIEKVGA